MPLHKAANFGNPTCLKWIFDKWDEYKVPFDVDAVDHQGYTPLYLVCHRGFLGVEGVESNSPETREKRIECVKILLKRGANINYRSPKLQMTALHWAAYQGDSEMVQLLLDNGALQLISLKGNTPVDIAGFCSNTEVVMAFCKNLEKQLIKDKEQMGGMGGTQ